MKNLGHKKLLIGVKPSKERLDGMFIIGSRLHLPYKIGLELPEDYEEREKNGFKVYYFGDIASYLKKSYPKDMQIIPLVSSKLYNRLVSIGMAMDVIEGKMDRKTIEDAMRYGHDLLKNDIEKFTACLGIEIGEETLNILDKAKTKDEIEALLKEGDKEYTECMLKKIIETEPHMVIVTDLRAKMLSSNLPEYKYICTEVGYQIYH